jgi:hypothetical protein
MAVLVVADRESGELLIQNGLALIDQVLSALLPGLDHFFQEVVAAELLHRAALLGCAWVEPYLLLLPLRTLGVISGEQVPVDLCTAVLGLSGNSVVRLASVVAVDAPGVEGDPEPLLEQLLDLWCSKVSRPAVDQEGLVLERQVLWSV